MFRQHAFLVFPDLRVVRLPRSVVVVRGIAAPLSGLVALVRGTDRIPPRDRVADVNHHRLLVFGADCPTRVHARVVSVNIGTVGVLQLQAEHFVDLQTLRPHLEGTFELRSRLLGPARIVDPFPYGSGEMNDAVLERRARLKVLVERPVHSAVHIGNGTDACAIHERNHLLVVFSSLNRATVKVEVDRRVLRLPDVRPLDDQQTLRHGVLLGRGLEIRMRRALGLRVLRCGGSGKNADDSEAHR